MRSSEEGKRVVAITMIRAISKTWDDCKIIEEEEIQRVYIYSKINHDFFFLMKKYMIKFLLLVLIAFNVSIKILMMIDVNWLFSLVLLLHRIGMMYIFCIKFLLILICYFQLLVIVVFNFFHIYVCFSSLYLFLSFKITDCFP